MRGSAGAKHVYATVEQLDYSERAFARMFVADSLAAQGRRCVYCRDPLSRQAATLDHVVPRYSGGTTSRDNSAAACEPCNTLKGPMTVSSFIALVTSTRDAATPGFAAAQQRYRRNT